MRTGDECSECATRHPSRFRVLGSLFVFRFGSGKAYDVVSNPVWLLTDHENALQ
jgi:hypothetical protein